MIYDLGMSLSVFPKERVVSNFPAQVLYGVDVVFLAIQFHVQRL
jgi:hypothetical protein